MAPATPTGGISDIVDAQKVNGSWSISILVSCCSLHSHSNRMTKGGKKQNNRAFIPTQSKLGISVEAATKALPATVQGKAESLEVWATVLVVLVLGAKFGAMRVEWDLLSKKAMKWVQKVGKSMAPDLDWEAQGKQFLQTQGITF